MPPFCPSATWNGASPGPAELSAGEAVDTAAKASSLPKEAQEQVDELKVKMRYFKAIGFHKQSGEARDQIVEIYKQNGVPVPDEYKE